MNYTCYLRKTLYLSSTKLELKMKKTLLYLTLFILPYILIGQDQTDLIQQIRDNPDKVESATLIQRIGGNTPEFELLNDLFKGLSRKVKKSAQGKFTKHYIDALKNTSEGKKAPGITQFDLAEEPYLLQVLGVQYVLISFEASWNTASRQEIPIMKEIYNEFKDNNFENLAVSFDSDFTVWNKYIHDNDLQWKHI